MRQAHDAARPASSANGAARQHSTEVCFERKKPGGTRRGDSLCVEGWRSGGLRDESVRLKIPEIENPMRYLALMDNAEVEFADEQAVEEAFRRKQISAECWIKIADVESDWETVEKLFPYLVHANP
jgi:hypothetical protein